MLAQARPLWSGLPDGALRRQLLAELATKGHLPTADLAQLWEGGTAKPRRSAGAQALEGTPDDREPRDAGDDPGGGGGSSGPDYANTPSGQRRERGGGGNWRDGKPGRWRGRDREREDPTAAPRRSPRTAPKTAQDRTVQMLLGHPQWWDDLSPDDHDLLHALPGRHGALVAWLERDLAEHGPRPWAVLSLALQQDTSLDEDARQLAEGDADPGATFKDFRRAVDVLLIGHLTTIGDALAREAEHDPSVLARVGQVFQHLREVKARHAAVREEDV
jgi:DNA primase